MGKKFKSFVSSIGRKGKAFICGAIATVSSCAMAVVASAEDVTPSSSINMGTMLSTAGETIATSFNDLIQTMIPVVMNILGGGLVIFGIFALIKYAKKILGKVAG